MASESAIQQLQREIRRAKSGRAEIAGGMGRSTFANLASVNASDGSIIFVTDGRKVGESAGAGTGIPAYFSGGVWRAFSSDAAVTV
jgi:hypothetical protein